VKALLEALGESGSEKDGEVENGTPTVLTEDFPALSRDAVTIVPTTPQMGPSTPSALPPSQPQRAPRQTRQRQIFPERVCGRVNPAIVCTDNHPELLKIQTCPDTQGKTTLPLIQEQRVVARCKSPALVEVHVHNDALVPDEGMEQGPLITLEERSGVIQPSSPGDSPCHVPGTELEGSLPPELLIDLGSIPITPPTATPKIFRP
ncbi:hypothetical protein Q7C36_015531, partial [Tachysurus vachellii]